MRRRPAGGATEVEAEAVVEHACRLARQVSGLRTDLLCRLLDRCRVPKLRGARRCAAALEAHEAAAARQSKQHTRASVTLELAEEHSEHKEHAAVSEAFFRVVGEAARLGKRFTAERLLEIGCTVTRRWQQ